MSSQAQGAVGAGNTDAIAWLAKRLKAARSDSEAHPEGHSNRAFYDGQAIAYENVLSLLEHEKPATPRTDSDEGTVGVGWAEVVKAICSAVCRIEGLDPDELRQEYESEAHGWRDTDPQWTRYAEAVAEVLDAHPLPSTPAPATPPGVPDSVRALSEAASPDWDTNEATPYILGPQIDGEVDRFEVIARGPHGHAKSGDAIREWQANRMFAVAAVNWVRALLSAHPAGQSTGQGADIAVDVAYLKNPPDGGNHHFGSPYSRRQMVAAGHEIERLRSAIPAPDSPLTGPVGGTVAVPASALRWLFGEGPDEDGVWFGDQIRGKGAFWWRSEFRKRIEAARPAAPEAQGAWMPIETAPQTDEDIWVACYRLDKHGKPYSFVTESSYEDTEYRRGFRHRNGAWGALYWQPKPKAPPVPEGHFNDTAPPSSGQGGR